MVTYDDPAGKCMLALALIGLAGCAQPRQVPARPVAVVTAFSDDFHSGIVLDAADAPPGLDPRPPGQVRQGWIAVHFGEQHWMDGTASTAWDAVRLAVVPGPGGVQCDDLSWIISDCGSSDPTRMRTWDFPVDAGQLAALHQRLQGWMAPGGPRVLSMSTWWWPSRRPWSVWTNCHDFTIDLLDAIGVRLPAAPIHLAAGLHAGLDRAWDAEQEVAHPPPVR